ncbi:epidermal growth factor receptor kinase substrate 8-like protein 3 [Macrotis lagotis]|uniref:epidermal growth factor receptor kinase substrate 8-like protein 3 n=1 Tax=Macrotis lagotis TaxID=92651 RepID=UPI003D69E78A
MTCKLGSRNIREPKDAIKKLQMMDAQGQVWGQNVILQIENQWLQILDIENKDELDSYPLDSIQTLDAISNSCSYNSVLLIILQEPGQSLTDVLLFQCWEVGAELLKNNLQKFINEPKENRQESRYRFRGIQPTQNRWEENSLESSSRNSPEPYPRNSPEPYPRNPPESSPRNPPEPYFRNPPDLYLRNPPESYPRSSPEHRQSFLYQSSIQEPQRSDQFPLQSAQPEPSLDLEKETDELNKTLSEIELLMKVINEAPKNKTKKKMIWGKKKTPEGLSLEHQYKQCFQLIKNALNLLGKLNIYLEQPSAPELIHLIFESLNMILKNCPNPQWAFLVDGPQITPMASDLLESCLTPNEMDLWKSLREFWTSSMQSAEPSEFSMISHQDNAAKDHGPISPSPSPSQSPLLMQVQYEFGSRTPQELSVTPREILEILDQSKSWWLVKNKAGQTGYIPNNILGPLQPDLQRNRGGSRSPNRGPMLRPTSKPQEVKEWLESENFSIITIKSLGMLTGSQLLHMKFRELKMVCPEDAPRLMSRLEAVKMTLGMGP